MPWNQLFHPSIKVIIEFTNFPWNAWNQLIKYVTMKQTNVILFNLHSVISRKKISWSSDHFHGSHRNNIPSNQLYTNFFSKAVSFTKFFQKCVRVICNFHTHSVEKREILSHLKNISSNQLFSNLFSKSLLSRIFCKKMREKEFQ